MRSISFVIGFLRLFAARDTTLPAHEQKPPQEPLYNFSPLAKAVLAHAREAPVPPDDRVANDALWLDPDA